MLLQCPKKNLVQPKVGIILTHITCLLYMKVMHIVFNEGDIPDQQQVKLQNLVNIPILLVEVMGKLGH